MPELLDACLVVLQILGVTSLTGALAFLAAYYAFPPNLTVEEVKDKGKHNFESRLVIRNIGKLPAHHIVADVKHMNFRMGRVDLRNLNTENCGVPTRELAASEKMELPACPHVGMPVGTSLDSCDYTLVLSYDLRLPFFRKRRSKAWRIELRNSGSESTWQASLL